MTYFHQDKVNLDFILRNSFLINLFPSLARSLILAILLLALVKYVTVLRGVQVEGIKEWLNAL